MKLRSLSLKNWKNFQRVDDLRFHDSTFVIGANAGGKSNLLDALRFLRDVAAPSGKNPQEGGLQVAVNRRGGLSRIRCLAARKDPEVRFQLVLEDERGVEWKYCLGFRGEGQGNNRILVSEESVETSDGRVRMRRPDKQDNRDRDLLTVTHLESLNSNRDFRPVSHFLAATTYLHLVPQLLKHSNDIGGNQLRGDPFGQGFLARLAETPKRTTDSRLRRIGRALRDVVPRFSEIRLERDAEGRPHLGARFDHWRAHGSWQRESQLSDGTLRLISLLWSLIDGDSLLLLEEPELSLNEAIVKEIPSLIRKLNDSSWRGPRQAIVTTHSASLLSDPAIGAESVIRLKPSDEGTELSHPSPEELNMLKSGFSVGETLLPAVRPERGNRLVASVAS